MSTISIESESRHENGWRFELIIHPEDEASSQMPPPSEHTVNLSWADYNLWSDGTTRPERVVRAVMEFLLQRREAHDLPASFDAATVRRWYRDADEHLSMSV